MRTAIFLGLLYIASAIDKDCLGSGESIEFIAVLILIMMFMDVLEFIKKMSSK